MDGSKKRLTFLWRILRLLLPLAMVLFLLAFATEFYVHTVSLISLDFLLALARDMLPPAIGLALVASLGAGFVSALYGLKGPKEGLLFFGRCLFGQPGFKPYLKITEGRIENGEDHTLRRVGGPGGLVIYNDSAVVLEQAGKLTRVVGPGLVGIELFEKVWEVIDLRPKRWVYVVKGMSKEGIPVSCEADIRFKIDDAGEISTEELPYAVSEEAVFTAACSKWIREGDRSEDDQVLDWAGRVVISETEGTLRSILARYPLDRLIGPASPDQKPPRQAIREELKRTLCKAAPKLGAQILSVDLGDIKVDDEVAQQWIETWRSDWRRWAMQRQAEGEAERVQQIETAKVQAQVDMIVAITEALQSLRASGVTIPSQLIVLRLAEVLRQASYDPFTRMFLPSEVISTLKSLEDMMSKPE